MARHQRTAKNDLNPNGGPGFCSKVTVTFTFAKRRIYLVMSAPSGEGGDCKLLWGKSSGCRHSWQFMQKCSERILLRLGMWADEERRETFERLTTHSWWIRLWISTATENKKLFEFCIRSPIFCNIILFDHLLETFMLQQKSVREKPNEIKSEQFEQ